MIGPFLYYALFWVYPILQPAVVKAMGFSFSRVLDDVGGYFRGDHIVFFVSLDDIFVDLKCGLVEMMLHV